MEHVQEVATGCAICGEVTRHVCSFVFDERARTVAPLLTCERASEHTFVLGAAPKSNVYPLRGRKAG